MTKAFVKDFIVSSTPDGELTFSTEYQHALFKDALKKLVSKKFRLSLTTKELQRTDKQNRLYHLYLEVIADEKGHTKDELHNYFKGKYLTTDIKEVFGQKTRLTKSTTGLSINDFAEFMLNIEAETNIPIPDVEAWRFGKL